MKIATVVLTYEVIKNGRATLLDRTLKSLGRRPNDKLILLDNGSTDGTKHIVSNYVEDETVDSAVLTISGNHTSARGNNNGAEIARDIGAEIILLSDDDVEWKPGWRERLIAFWGDAPDRIKLAGGILEPEAYYWSKIFRADTIGGQRALIRSSTGAASWSFRARDYGFIFPLNDTAQGIGDVGACQKLIDRHYEIAQLDLATHIGAGYSVWGNNLSEQKYPPLDLQKWGFPHAD